MAAIEFGDNKAQQFLTEDNGYASITFRVISLIFQPGNANSSSGFPAVDFLYLALPQMVQMERNIEMAAQPSSDLILQPFSVSLDGSLRAEDPGCSVSLLQLPDADVRPLPLLLSLSHVVFQVGARQSGSPGDSGSGRSPFLS